MRSDIASEVSAEWVRLDTFREADQRQRRGHLGRGVAVAVLESGQVGDAGERVSQLYVARGGARRLPVLVVAPAAHGRGREGHLADGAEEPLQRAGREWRRREAEGPQRADQQLDGLLDQSFARPAETNAGWWNMAAQQIGDIEVLGVTVDEVLRRSGRRG